MQGRETRTPEKTRCVEEEEKEKRRKRRLCHRKGSSSAFWARCGSEGVMMRTALAAGARFSWCERCSAVRSQPSSGCSGVGVEERRYSSVFRGCCLAEAVVVWASLDTHSSARDQTHTR